MKTVLVLEDDEISLALYRRVLSRTCCVLVATTPDEAERICAANHVDLYIADNGLGTHVSGAEALHRVHEQKPQMCLLLVSGTPPEGFDEDSFECFTALVHDCVCDFLQKPFKTETFLKKVNAILTTGVDVDATDRLLSSALAYRRSRKQHS